MQKQEPVVYNKEQEEAKEEEEEGKKGRQALRL